MAKRTIIVTGYFGEKEHGDKLSYFERVDAHLREQDTRLLIVNLAPKALKSRCDSLSLPHFIPYAPFLERIPLPRRITLKTELEEAVQLESGDLGLTTASAALKLLYFRAFMRRLLRRERPALCVLWHQFNGLHHALADLLNESRIPYCFVEYGYLPGMIAFDPDGQMAEGWVAIESSTFRGLPVAPEVHERVDQYLEAARVQKKTQRDQPENEDALRLIRELRAQGKTALFFAGDYAYRSGMLPSGFPRAGIHSPYFESTAAALARLADLASKNDWHIIFKPHPLATDPAGAPEAPNEHVTVVPDANVFDCMLHCDLTLTILSQVSYLALIQKRAVVLLGRNPLSGKGCLYELESIDDLEHAVSHALRDGLSDDQYQAFRHHAAQLCSHYLYSMNQETEKLFSRGPSSAAEFLLDLMEPSESPGEAQSQAPLAGTWGTDADAARPWTVRALYAVFMVSAPIVRAAVPLLPAGLKQHLQNKGRWF